MKKNELLCKRCKKPVKINKDEYETFEGMHWLCFHLEYEHGTFDPDEPCSDPGCPWKLIKIREDIIKKHKMDLDKEIEKWSKERLGKARKD